MFTFSIMKRVVTYSLSQQGWQFCKRANGRCGMWKTVGSTLSVTEKVKIFIYFNLPVSFDVLGCNGNVEQFIFKVHSRIRRNSLSNSVLLAPPSNSDSAA